MQYHVCFGPLTNYLPPESEAEDSNNVSMAIATVCGEGVCVSLCVSLCVCLCVCICVFVVCACDKTFDVYIHPL